jgi:glycosyltransferase involved in cell wall biosynthesis
MYSGGGERTALYETLMLRKMGHSVTCFAPAIRKDICFPELIVNASPRGILPSTRLKIPLRDFAGLVASSVLAPLFSRNFNSFDVILSHGQPATWMSYAISRIASKPHVTYLHQPARFLYPRMVDLRVGWRTKTDFALLEDIVRTIRPIVEMLDRISVSTSNEVVVNSHWIGEQVGRIYGLKPILCYPGVDTDKFKPLAQKHVPDINRYEIDRPYVLTTNRHYPQKGLSDLLRIYDLVRRRVDVKLVVTGEYTRYTRTLKELAVDLDIDNNVIFTGRVTEDELVSLYQNADAYAFTAPEEDFGLGPIESMATGTPPVVWNYAGPSETVIDGVTGFKAKPYDVKDFASKIIHILRNPAIRMKLSRNGVKHARLNYSWVKHVTQLEKILAKAVNN